MFSGFFKYVSYSKTIEPIRYFGDSEALSSDEPLSPDGLLPHNANGDPLFLVDDPMSVGVALEPIGREARGEEINWDGFDQGLQLYNAIPVDLVPLLDDIKRSRMTIIQEAVSEAPEFFLKLKYEFFRGKEDVVARLDPPDESDMMRAIGFGVDRYEAIYSRVAKTLGLRSSLFLMPSVRTAIMLYLQPEISAFEAEIKAAPPYQDNVPTRPVDSAHECDMVEFHYEGSFLVDDEVIGMFKGRPPEFVLSMQDAGLYDDQKRERADLQISSAKRRCFGDDVVFDHAVDVEPDLTLDVGVRQAIEAAMVSYRESLEQSVGKMPGFLNELKNQLLIFCFEAQQFFEKHSDLVAMSHLDSGFSDCVKQAKSEVVSKLNCDFLPPVMELESADKVYESTAKAQFGLNTPAYAFVMDMTFRQAVMKHFRDEIPELTEIIMRWHQFRSVSK